jgi:hypothetical protein
MLKYHVVTFLIGAIAAIGGMMVAGPFDEGPWPMCQYEDGNVDGNECIWYNDGQAWYVDSSEYRN